MNKIMKNFTQYLLTVIAPTLCVSILLLVYHTVSMQKQNKAAAEADANIYKNHIDRFIGESISSVETLAAVISSTGKSEKEITQMFDSTTETKPEFFGFYYSHQDAGIFLSSHPLTKTVNVGDQPYIQEALHNKKTTVSPALKGRVSGTNVIVIATPVLTKQKELNGLLMAGLQQTYIYSLINDLNPPHTFEITDVDGKVFESSTPISSHLASREKVTVSLDKAPWKVSVYPLPIDKATLYQKLIIECFVTLFFMNIIYLYIKLLLLKRQTKMERRQNEVQKLELVGMLAASTAHEIRNPLTGIKGLVTLLGEKHQNEEDQFYISVIQNEIDRINEIVSEFLVLGKPTAVICHIYDVKEIIKEVSLIIQSEANLRKIQFILSMDDSPLQIRCSKDHIKQIILNVSKNAFEAMKKDDTLTIEATAKEGYAQVRIVDSGNGIPDELKQKIFEPFFTNKETGSGLGLVVCKRIIDIYNGKIEIISQEGIGTTVHISIPLYSD
ncbi:ATP-binding protein [Microbacteriaceae bacterium 4G12]